MQETSYTFAGGYRIGDKTVVLIQADSTSAWLSPGQSFKNIRLISVAEDFQSVLLQSSGTEFRVPIVRPTDLPIEVEVDEEFERLDQYSPGLEELRQLLQARGADPEIIEGVLAYSHRQETAAKEMQLPKNGTQFTREEIIEYAEAQAQRGNLVLWKEDGNGMVTDLNTVVWPAGQAVIDSESGEIRIPPMPEEQALEIFARQFEVFNGTAVDALPAKPQP